MFTKTEIARAARMLTVAAAVAVTGLTAGCGGDDDNGGGGGGGGGGGNVNLGDAPLNTSDGAKAQVGTLAALIDTLGTLDDLSSADAPAAAAAKASDPCPAGGGSEDTGPTSKNVGSPYTSKNLDVTTTKITDCKFTTSSDDGHGNKSSTSAVVNGVSEDGSTEDGGSIFYAKIGDNTDKPLKIVYDLKLDTAGGGGAPATSSTTNLDFGIFYRTDSKETNSSDDEKFSLSFSGKYKTSGTANGTSFSADGNFTSFVGKTDAPFTYVQNNGLVKINGEYGFGVSPAPAGANCTNASVKIETPEDLMENPNDGGSHSPFTAGTIKLSSGSNSATVKFNNDDTVTVTAGGETKTYSWSEARSTAAGCTGFAFAGIAFVGAAAN